MNVREARKVNGEASQAPTSRDSTKTCGGSSLSQVHWIHSYWQRPLVAGFLAVPTFRQHCIIKLLFHSGSSNPSKFTTWLVKILHSVYGGRDSLWGKAHDIVLEAGSRLRIISKDDDSTCWPAWFSTVLQDIHLVFFAVSKYCYSDHIYLCVKLLHFQIVLIIYILSVPCIHASWIKNRLWR